MIDAPIMPFNKAAAAAILQELTVNEADQAMLNLGDVGSIQGVTSMTHRKTL